jgi:hypothetical protein
MTAPDPLALTGNGHVLDAAATRVALEVMQRLAEVDRILFAIGDKSFVLERTGSSVKKSPVAACGHRQWICAPEDLITTDHHAGRLTVRGQYALAGT